MNENNESDPVLRDFGLYTSDSELVAPRTSEIPGSIISHIEKDWSGSTVMPDRIGPYRILGLLGEGGFGVVYHAEQQAPIVREVALKVIRPGLGSSDIIRRFGAEKQALALMEHPNVAAVLDAGTTDEGIPFFVMELVRGKPLTDYCDEKRLTIRQRLELFIPVCLAVHHAHQKAILHRDLKPSNILVTEVDGKPVPKVIDFGIAKALGASVTDADGGHTMAGAVMGTPQYMSPEQAGTAADLDTRSDIYTIGVILYELLTGRPPLSREVLRQVVFEEVLRIVREGEVGRPSSVIVPVTAVTESVAAQRQTTARRLGEAVKGELDWIVLKATEKDRDRRYDSAVALAEDIRRFIDKKPVLCGPPSRLYAVKKLMQRNRIACLSAVSSIALLAVSSVVVTWLWWTAESEREIAQQAKLSLERLVNSMLYNLGAKLETIGKTDLLKEATRQAKEYYIINSSSKPEDQRNAAAMWSNLGDVQLAAGELSDARKSYTEAMAMHERVAQSEPGSLRSRRDLSVGYARLGDIALANGDRTLARDYLKRVVAIRERIASADSEDAEAQRDLSIGYARMGDLEESQGNSGGALEFWSKSVSLLEAISLRNPHSAEARYDLGIAYRRMGKLAQVYDDGPTARICFGRSKDCLEMVVSRSPSDSNARRTLRSVLEDAGKLAETQSDVKSAKAFYGASITISEQLLAENKDDLISGIELSRNYSRLGELGAAENDSKLAYEFFGKSIDMLNLLILSDPQNIGCLRDLCSGYRRIAAVAESASEKGRAHQFLGQAVSILERMCQSDPENLRDQRELAIAYSKMAEMGDGDSQKKLSSEYREMALGILKRIVGTDPVNSQYKIDLAMTHYAFSKVTDKVESDEHLRQSRALLGEVVSSGKTLSEREKGILDGIEAASEKGSAGVVGQRPVNR
jgi:serine/threonine protein kinase